MTSDRGFSGGAESLETAPVTPKGQSLNPNAHVFQSKSPTTPTSDPGEWPLADDESPTETTPSSEGFPLVNGTDVETLEPPGVIYPPTPESPSPPTQDYASTNGSVPGSISGDTQYTAETPTVSDEASPLDGSIPEDQLRSMLATQLEYYFSRENLASDSYLISQMDADQYVAISTIANFNQVKKLTNNLDLVVEVLRESSNVQVDEKGEKVRPLHKRCIVILREVPESTPVQAVRDLFSGKNCPKYISCEFAANNSWYVTFDSDEDAQKAYQYLREEIRSFLGRPIMARIKAKPLVRSTFVPVKNGMKQQFEPSIQVAPTQQRYPSYPQVQPVPYVNGQQQSYPFFSPNTVIPAWPTNTAAYFDPGMIQTYIQDSRIRFQVFAANGYTPGGTFKLNSATTRPTFQQPRSRNIKPHKNERGSSIHDRHQVVNSGTNTNLSRTSPRSDAVHGGPGGPRKGDFSHHPSHHHSSQVPEPQNVHGGAPRLNRQADTQTRESQRSEVPPRRPPYRSRRRRDDDGTRNRSNASQPAAKDLKPAESPNFDLESTAFPPLPGSNNSTNTGEVFENKMSDVVKGTAKPLTRDIKTQTQPAQVPHSPTRESKETSTTQTPATSNNNDSTSVASTSTTALLPTPPQSPLKVSKSVGTSDQSTLTETTTSRKADASTSTTNGPEEPSDPVATSGNDTVGDDCPANTASKLSYAQMVQRSNTTPSKPAEGCAEVRSDESDRESCEKGAGSSSSVQKQPMRENSQCSPGGSPVRGHKEEPRDQRPRGVRRMKENREDRRDRDLYRDRRRDRERDRDLPVKSFAK